MVNKKENAIRLKGLMMVRNGVYEVVDLWRFEEIARDIPAELRVRDMISKTLEAQYDAYLVQDKHLNNQPIYCEMERIVQSLPKWQKMHEMAEKNRKKNCKQKDYSTEAYIQIRIEQKKKRIKIRTWGGRQSHYN